jgi:hypothetical protein
MISSPVQVWSEMRLVSGAGHQVFLGNPSGFDAAVLAMLGVAAANARSSSLGSDTSEDAPVHVRL